MENIDQATQDGRELDGIVAMAYLNKQSGIKAMPVEQLLALWRNAKQPEQEHILYLYKVTREISEMEKDSNRCNKILQQIETRTEEIKNEIEQKTKAMQEYRKSNES